jgi:hydrogenase maturation protease
MGIAIHGGFDVKASQISIGSPEVRTDCGAGRVAVLGLGNILLSDEGVGVHAMLALKQRYAFSPEVDFIDGGTMGLDLLPIFQERDRILIIDAVDFKKQPGHVGVMNGRDIPSVLNAKLSAHHIGLSDLLFTAKLMCETLPEVLLIGIQPRSLDVGLDMTSEIIKQLDTVIAQALKSLKAWGISSMELPGSRTSV